LQTFILCDYRFEEDFGGILSRSVNPGLRRLRLESVAASGVVAQSLSNFTNLRSLEVRLDRCRFDDLDWETLAGQTSLRELDILCDQKWESWELVRLEETIEKSTKLVKLDVGRRVPFGWLEKILAAAPKGCVTNAREEEDLGRPFLLGTFSEDQAD
jgi:hypothetical protein